MNILLLVAPAPTEGTYPFSTAEKRPPLGVASLVSVLRKNGHKVYFEDFYLHKVSLLYDAMFLLEKRIDLVGMYSSSITWIEALKILQRLHNYREKKLWNGLLAVGGPHTSFNSSKMPSWIDYIVIGEGEKTLCEIAEGKIEPGIIRGKPVEDMDSLPLLPWEDIVPRPYDRTAWGMPFPVYTLNTSRGCPFSCTFCSVKGIWGRTYRHMSVERIIEEVDVLKKYYGAQSIYFREDHFTLNRQRTLHFCEELIHRNLNLSWSCESRADSIDDEETIKLMAHSGCKCLYIGVESGSPRLLQELKKGETVEQFIRVFDLAHKYGIHTYASMIYGLPGETEEDIYLTESFLRRLSPSYIGRNVFAGLPGSDLYDKIVDLDLCAYEDEISGIRYLKGHNERVRRYYGSHTRLLIPGTPPVSPGEPQKPSPVSVITCVYNGEETIARCIESIQKQSHTAYEHIIIDDGSTDNTVSIVQNYAAGDPRIRILRNERNRQQSYSRNRGMEVASHDLIAILDADDEALPHRLERQANCLDKHPKLTLCGGGIVVRESGVSITPPLTEENIRASILFTAPFFHPTVMFRKKKLLSLTGGYDENVVNAQDYDLWVRLAKHQYIHFMNINQTLTIYSSPKGKSQKMWPNQEKTVRLALRNFMKVRCLAFNDQQEQFHIDTFIHHKYKSLSEISSYCRHLAWCVQNNPMCCRDQKAHAYTLYIQAICMCPETKDNAHWHRSFMRGLYPALCAEFPVNAFESLLTTLGLSESENII